MISRLVESVLSWSETSTRRELSRGGASLAHVLVNSVTDKVRYMTVKEVFMRNVADVFGRFRKYELTTNHRLKGQQTELRGILRHLRNHTKPITRGFLAKLSKLKRQDEMTKAERAKWKFCPVMVVGNATRHRINEFQGVEFGKEKNVPILEFYDGISKITDPDELAEISRMVGSRLKAPTKHLHNSRMLVVVYQTLYVRSFVRLSVRPSGHDIWSPKYVNSQILEFI